MSSVFNEEAINKQIELLRKAFEDGWNAHKYAQLTSRPFTAGMARNDVEVAIDGGIKDPFTLSILYIKQKPQV